MDEGGYVQNDCVGSCIGKPGGVGPVLLSSGVSVWWTRERQVPIDRDIGQSTADAVRYKCAGVMERIKYPWQAVSKGMATNRTIRPVTMKFF